MPPPSLALGRLGGLPRRRGDAFALGSSRRGGPLALSRFSPLGERERLDPLPSSGGGRSGAAPRGHQFGQGSRRSSRDVDGLDDWRSTRRARGVRLCLKSGLLRPPIQAVDAKFVRARALEAHRDGRIHADLAQGAFARRPRRPERLPGGVARWRREWRRGGCERLSGLGSSRRRRRGRHGRHFRRAAASPAVGERGLKSARRTDRQAKLPNIISLERVEAVVVDAFAPAILQVAGQAEAREDGFELAGRHRAGAGAGARRCPPGLRLAMSRSHANPGSSAAQRGHQLAARDARCRTALLAFLGHWALSNAQMAPLCDPRLELGDM